MSPFDYVLSLVSFIYALALTHLLTAAARMVRHRRQIVFSWPHALWMAMIFIDLVINWLTFWDAHNLKVIDLAATAAVMVTATSNYFVVALVTPEFERDEDYDLVRFQARQGRAYLTALLVFGLVAFAGNATSPMLGLQWSEQNVLVGATFVPVLAALFIRRPLVQVLAPLVELAFVIWYALQFYPRIA